MTGMIDNKHAYSASDPAPGFGEPGITKCYPQLSPASAPELCLTDSVLGSALGGFVTMTAELSQALNRSLS